MNPPPDSPTDPRQIRTEIDQTRHRMDETIDALGRRFEGRHLVDEAIHFVRKQTENGKMTQLKHQLKHSADTAVHTVVDTVKANPIPAALIGAGIAWYVYAQKQEEPSYDRFDYAADDVRYEGYVDEPYGGASGGFDVAPSAAGQAPGLGERMREKTSELRAKSREALHTTRERAGEMGARVSQRSRELARRGRERVASGFERHPLEAGLITLALGLAVGLALPTPQRVRTAVAPRARQLRQRGEDMLERGRQVARSAADAARQEAEAQGLATGGSSERPSQTRRADSPAGSPAPTSPGAAPTM